MKRVFTAVSLAVVAAVSHAAPPYLPTGSNLTYGAVSNGQSVTSDITNPAAGAAVLDHQGENQYRLGLPGSFGMGVEFGQFDDLYARIDAEATKFQDPQLLTGVATPQEAVDQINAAIDSLNTVMSDVQENGYAKVFSAANIPLVVAHDSFGGSLAFNAGISAASRVTGLYETVVFDAQAALNGVDAPDDDVSLTFDNTGLPTGFTVDNDSTVLIKASLVTDISLGYSRPLIKADGATLYAGARAHYYTVEQSQFNVRLANLNNNVEQQFEDAMTQERASDSGLGVDLGLLWASEHYRIGVTYANINEPSFEGIAADLTNYDPNSSVAQRLMANGTYTMERQLSVEASLYTASRNWVISAAMDTNPVKDALGDEYQWTSFSAAYATDSWYLPGIRAGYRSNLAGSEITYYSAGLTIAILNLDVAWSPDEIVIDGESVPRGAMMNLGLEFSF